jgi:hypothetical protein
MQNHLNETGVSYQLLEHKKAALLRRIQAGRQVPIQGAKSLSEQGMSE